MPQPAPLAGYSEERIDFQQCANAFLQCGNPARLQKLADSLTARDLLQCGQKRLAAFTPFFSDKERKQAGCQHRLFFPQVEYCDNLILHRAAVDQLTQRLGLRLKGVPHANRGLSKTCRNLCRSIGVEAVEAPHGRRRGEIWY
jgi:hypothetical protein